MFRRSTKITSLIVAAASVATMVPAMAATTKVEEKDGTVYSAVAYKDGNFYIDGDLEDKDEDVYYLSNGEYKELDDIDSGDEVGTIYNGKYLELEEGDYYLDLSTGKVTEDDIKEDSQDDARSALRKKIRKDNDGRYAEGTDQGQDEGLPNLEGYVPASPYAEDWYEFKYDNKEVKPETNGGATEFTVYSDINGNYIDADYNLGKINITAEYGTTSDSVTLKNTSDDYGDNKIRAALSDTDTLGSDKDYIYRKAVLTVTAPGATDIFVGSKNKPISASAFVSVDETTGASLVIPVIQKISKAQGDDVDGAKYAKNVTTYFITNDGGRKKELESKEDKLNLGDFTITNGKVVVYGVNDASFKVNQITLKSSNGLNFVDVSDTDFDVDYEAVDDDRDFDASIDVDGRLWVVTNGSVKKLTDDCEFEKVYKVDGALNRLSVYDEKNLIVWNEDEEVYSIVGGKSSTDAKEEETTTPAAATWVQDATTGAWSYVKADGTKAIGWFQSPTSGLWYYMDANGVMQANGWIQDGGYWYFLDASGAMKTGWVYTGGAWYFLKPTAGNKGAMQTGWIQTGGKWYYCNASGAMLSNTTVGGYVLGADGAWIK